MADTFNKRFSSGDVFTIPYDANKQWIIPSESFDSYNIHGKIGIKPPSTVLVKDYTPEHKLYQSVLANFYSEVYPTSSLSTSSYLQTNNLTETLTAESYAVSGTYLEGNKVTTVKNYPTSESSQIFILNVPHKVYSNKILPTTVELELEGGYKVYDDGEYNLYWSGSTVNNINGGQISQSQHIGNVFYEKGLIVFTSVPDYNITPIMINVVTSTDEVCSNSGTITVTTTQGSGDFTYELIEKSIIVTPPINTNTYTFTSINHGGYNVKITDNVLGTIQTKPVVVNASSPLSISYAYLEAIPTVVRNDRWLKITDIVYNLVTYYFDPTLGTTVKGIPAGVTIEATYDQYYEFVRNYNSTNPTITTGGGATARPFVINKNGVNDVIGYSLYPISPTLSVCNGGGITRTQRRYRNTPPNGNTLIYTSTDTVSITARMVVNTPSPSTGSACESEGALKYTFTPWSLRQVNACGVRTNINFVANPITGITNPEFTIRN